MSCLRRERCATPRYPTGAQAQIDRANLNLERTRIRAPFDGRVRTKRIDVGQVVGPGVPLGRIYAVDYAEIELPIPDRQLAFLDLDLSFNNSGEIENGPIVDLLANFAGSQRTWRAMN